MRGRKAWRFGVGDVQLGGTYLVVGRPGRPVVVTAVHTASGYPATVTADGLRTPVLVDELRPVVRPERGTDGAWLDVANGVWVRP